MGRKGGGGGSAGGGRSGSRENVTFRRVVPKFLQDLIGEGVIDGQETRCNSMQDKDRSPTEPALALLETQSHFAKKEESVVEDGCTAMENAVSSERNKTAGDKDIERIAKIKGDDASLKESMLTKPRVLRGGIRKQVERGSRPSKASKKRDRQKLSFRESDDESDGT